MRIATAAYPLDWFDTWTAFESKARAWVSEAAEQGAELLVFPEYGAMELASLAGRNVSMDMEQSLRAVSGFRRHHHHPHEIKTESLRFGFNNLFQACQISHSFSAIQSRLDIQCDNEVSCRPLSAPAQFVVTMSGLVFR